VEDAVDYAWLQLICVVAIGLVVVTAFGTKPLPGLHGRHLAMSIALAVFAGGVIGIILMRTARLAIQLPLLIAVVVSSATIIGLEQGGPGFVGLFPVVSSAALRLPARLGGAIVGTAAVALAVGYVAGGKAPVAGIVLNELAVVAFYFVSTFARRYRETSEESQRLVAELEQTRAAQTQAAALAERQRLAREMHDVLAHSLSGLVLNLEGARLIAVRGEGNPEVADAIERAHRLAKSGLEEARRAIGMLRDDALPGAARLAALVADFEQDSGVACTFEIEGEERELGSDGRLTCYRVAQEALTNIRKHARPERVQVRLSYEPAGTRLTVEDLQSDGRRFPPGDGTGYGLTGMRERAELLGGTLTAGPTTAGFRVELWVPA
jgi:signal transduction histidine kinase